MNSLFEFSSRFRILKGGKVSLVVSALLTASSLIAAPSGGVVTSGNASISQNGNITNINQSSNKASINWNDFSIDKNETVNFNQPNQNSITLNRVVGNEKSIIDGALNANGQVWLINQNGTIFNKNSKVNTAGLLVTTKNLSDEDFQAGNYNFKGDSKAEIKNFGEINLNDKAYALFVANSVVNSGEIIIHKGTIHLASADEFTVSLADNSNVKLKVTKGTLDALVENNNLIKANGGNIYLTTNAKNELLKGVVNNIGRIEANSLDDITGKESEVIIYAHGGTANIDGEIKAKNSFVETSGEKLSVKDSFKIEAKTWLLDPTNITIDSNGTSTTVGDANSVPSGSDATISATTLQTALSSTDVTLQADNNIKVNENITWSETTQLKLKADNINVNATINNTNSTNGGVYFDAASDPAWGYKVYFNNNGKVVIHNINQLQWISQAIAGRYELGSNIDASATSSWNSNKGFKPIGSDFASSFEGIFDGKGYVISDLYINRPEEDNVGLFGHTYYTSSIKNVGLEKVNITGKDNVGGLIGNHFAVATNSYVTGLVTGNDKVGGLAGFIWLVGTKNVYSSATVNGNSQVGGLIGKLSADLEDSYSTGDVRGVSEVGGLIGNYSTHNNAIKNSYSIGNVSGNVDIGGFIGKFENTTATIKNSFYDSTKNSKGVGSGSTAGLVGKSTEELSYGGTFKDASWNIVSDSSVISPTPVLKYDNSSNTTYWAISPVYLNYILGAKNTIYNSLVQKFSTFYTDNPIKIPIGYESFIVTPTSYLFQDSKGEIGYRNAGSYYVQVDLDYSDIKNEFLAISNSGNSDGIFTINQKDINSLSYIVSDKIYDGTLNATVSGTSTDFIENDEIGFSQTAAFEDKDAGIDKIVNITNITLIGKDADNYKLVHPNSTTANAYIAKKDATVIANSISKVYNGIEQSVNGFTASGLVDGETESVLTGVSGDTASGKNTGTYTTTLRGTDKNYNLSCIDGTLTITKADATITANSMITVYNGLEQQVCGFIATGLVNSETESVLTGVSGDTASGTNAGIYTTTLSGTDANYNLTFVDGTLTINKANATVTANSDSKTYSGLNQSVSGFTASGLVNNETEEVLSQISGAMASGTNAGIYTTTLSGTDANYNLTFVDGTLTINKANLVAKANDDSKIYNSLAYSGGKGVSYSGFVNNENESVLDGKLVYSGSSQGAVNVGTYNISADGLESNNYNISYEDGELVIEDNIATKVIQGTESSVVSTNPIINNSLDNTISSNSDSNNNETGLDFNNNVQTFSLGSLGNANLINGGINLPEDNLATNLADLSATQGDNNDENK